MELEIGEIYWVQYYMQDARLNEMIARYQSRDDMKYYFQPMNNCSEVDFPLRRNALIKIRKLETTVIEEKEAPTDDEYKQLIREYGRKKQQYGENLENQDNIETLGGVLTNDDAHSKIQLQQEIGELEKKLGL